MGSFLAISTLFAFWYNDPNKSVSTINKKVSYRYKLNKDELFGTKEWVDSLLNHSSCYQYTATYTVKGLFWHGCDSNKTQGNVALTKKQLAELKALMEKMNLQKIVFGNDLGAFTFYDLAYKNNYVTLYIGAINNKIKKYFSVDSNVYYSWQDSL